MLKKLLTFSVVSLLFLSLFLFKFSSSIYAQTSTSKSTWFNQDYRDWFTKVYDDTNPTEIFGERYTAAQVQWIIYSLASMPFTGIKNIMLCAFSPKDVALCAKAVSDLKAEITSSSAYAQIPSTQLNPWKEIFLSNRSFSGISYVRNKIRDFNIIPVANAQTEGFGYNAIWPIQNLWVGVRNISYAFFVLVVVAYAFMIMFRMKLSPQTAITIQSALPKLIITIVVVTFSYAIAGFMVDLIYVMLGIISAVFSNALGGDWGFYWILLTGGNLGLLGVLFLYFILFLISLVLNAFALVISSLTNLVIGGVFFIILFIVALILCLGVIFYATWQMIRVIITLVKAVGNIFISVMFAPLTLTASSLGMGGGVGAWLKGLFGSILAFPIAGALIIMAYVFMSYSYWYGIGEIGTNSEIKEIFNIIVNPQLGAIVGNQTFENRELWAPPLMGDGWTGLIFLFTSFTCISLIPKAVDIAKGLMEGKQINYGSAIGEAMAPVKTAGLSSLQYLSSRQSEQYSSLIKNGENPRSWQKTLNGVLDVFGRLGITKR